MTRAPLAALLVAAALPCSAETAMRHAMPRSETKGTINAQTIACETPETFGTVLIMLDRHGTDGALNVMRQYPGDCHTLVVGSPVEVMKSIDRWNWLCVRPMLFPTCAWILAPFFTENAPPQPPSTRP
jgi:hypothetical protein